jgi:hypothetical protein
MRQTIKLLAGLAMGLWLSGCSTASLVTVRVNGYTDPGSPAQLQPGGAFFVMENQGAKNPLLEREIKEKLHKLLLTRGYPTTTYEKADYYLFFGYGMGEPRSVAGGGADYYGGWGWGFGFGGPGPGGYIMVGPSAAYAPNPAIIYDRWLLINVVDGPSYRHQKASQPVWVGEARSVGSSSDLRTMLNYLLVADFKEFGKNTGKAITLEIDADNPEVTSLTR